MSRYGRRRILARVKVSRIAGKKEGEARHLRSLRAHYAEHDPDIAWAEIVRAHYAGIGMIEGEREREREKERERETCVYIFVYICRQYIYIYTMTDSHLLRCKR